MTTTPNTVALQALLDRVEAGEASWNRLASIAEDAMPPKEAALAATANRGSLDAALALHNAVLPGWFFYGGHLNGADDGYAYHLAEAPFPEPQAYSGFSDETPPALGYSPFCVPSNHR